MPGPSQIGRLPDSRIGYNALTDKPSVFYHGTIANVSADRWTVDVQIHETGQIQYDIPIMTPYYFKERGQGLFFIPEPGAICIVVNAQGQYFVLGFLPPIDATYSAQVSPPKQDLTQPANQQSGTSEVSDPAHVSYRSNREGDMVAGDACLKTRAGNKLKLFTNGNILVSATYLCLRLYSKLENWIHDVCVNYLLRTPGGEVQWHNQTTGCEYTRQFKMRISDVAETVREDIGPSIGVCKRTVQTVAKVPKFTEHIDGNGNVTVFIAGNNEVAITGNDALAVTGNQEIAIQKDKNEVIVGASTLIVNGPSYTVTATAGGISISSTGPLALQSDTEIQLTSPGGIMNMAAGITSWAVTGDLGITATGSITINPVGPLNLAPV